MARRTFGLDLTAVTWTAGVADALSLARGVTGITVWDAQTGGTQITDLQTVGGSPITTVSSDANGVIGFKGPDTTPDTVALWLAAPGQPVRQQIVASDLPDDTALKSVLPLNVRDYGAKGNGTTDDAPAIQAAFNAALNAGGGWVQVPPGTYLLSTLPLRIYGNTRLTLMPGAEFRRNAAATMLLNGDAAQNLGGYTGHGNIIVEGGLWNMRGTTTGLTASAMCISIGHARGVTIRNLEIRDLPGYHGIELNSTQTGRVLDCQFRGYVDPGGRDFSEAVQIDLAKGSAYFGGFGPYDNTSCQDIEVRGCYVGASGTSGTTAWPRGIGSHSATIGTRHSGIRIIGNTFDGLTQYAVGGYDWRDVVIEGNVIDGCGAGIRMRTVDTADTNDTLNTSGSQTSASQDMRDIAIVGNVIRNGGGTDDGILLMGESTGKVLSATVANNTIETTTSSQNGIRAEYAEQYTITGNLIRDTAGTGISQQNIAGGVITGNRVYNPTGSGISCDTGTGMQISDNAIREPGVNGIHVIGGTDVQVIDNWIKSPSRASAGSYGIRCSTSADGLRIVGNKVRKHGSGNEPAYGLSVTSTCTNVRRWGNDLTDSGTSGPLDDQSTGPITASQDVLTALKSQATLATAANTASETAVASWTIPAGDPLAGAAYRIVVYGTASTTGTPTLQFRIRHGGTGGVAIAAYTAVTTSSGISGRGWRIEAVVHCISTGSSGTWSGGGTLAHHLDNTVGQEQRELTDGTVTKDTTTDQTLTVTAQWGTASASNTCSATAGVLQRIA